MESPHNQSDGIKYISTNWDFLLQSIRLSQTSDHTIRLVVNYLFSTYNIAGSAFAGVLSQGGFGLDWKFRQPEDLFTENILAIDFSPLVSTFQTAMETWNVPVELLINILPQTKEWCDHLNIERIFLVPTHLEQDITGVFVLFKNSAQGIFEPDEIQQIRSLVGIVEIILQWQLKTEQIEQKIFEQDKMLRASLSMTESLNLEEVLNAILKNALELIPTAHDAHIFLYENEILNFGAALFHDGASGEVWAEPRPDGLTYTVARQKKIIAVNDIRSHELFRNAPADWHGSIIGIPLLNDDTVIGVMTLANLVPQNFNEHEIQILNRLADQAANVIQNVRTHSLIILQAFTDPLTGLPNRRSFEWEAQNLLNLAHRYGYHFSVAMLDLNGFKRINDTYGHAVGDDTLRIIAHCMKSAMRKSDFLARYGGDEFILLLPETDTKVGKIVLQKILDRVQKCYIPVESEKYECLSVSYGLATYPSDDLEIKNLVNLADKNMYENKQFLNNSKDNYLVV
ncbi:MAG: hypothetical protein CVU39_08885 [Chloroflexi bacterium HGW-Chloroflexi-10]|nr:MAG: hypothetical protein CVU39_08885 [Chloroflexi bacterium HGW-Chloroflexi-10]